MQQSEQLIDAANPWAILKLARKYGNTELITHSDGSPLIRGTIDGEMYVIIFSDYGDGNDYKFIQFRAYWESNNVTLNDVNEWNRKHVFVNAFLDDDGDPEIRMAVSLNHGVSRENLDDTIDWWVVLFKKFKKKFNL